MLKLNFVDRVDSPSGRADVPPGRAASHYIRASPSLSNPSFLIAAKLFCADSPFVLYSVEGLDTDAPHLVFLELSPEARRKGLGKHLMTMPVYAKMLAERKIKVNLARASEALDQSHIVVVSFNGNVLLAGEVASDELRVQAENIAARVRHVRHVHNELKLSGDSGVLSRVNDGWLTTKLKPRLFVDGDAPGMRTKVVTVSGIVYLMGLLTRDEADAVVAQAREVGGVQKIVKIIEYID